MNCLLVCQSEFWVATIIFYTCIVIPLQKLKKTLLSMVSIVSCFSSSDKARALDIDCLEIRRVPAVRFENLQSHSLVGGCGKIEEICSICLVEFEREIVVSKLGICGHVFHLNCMESWLQRNNFTCPLCRSLLFPQHHME